MRFTRLAAGAALLGAAAAQVHTDCQPLNRTDCPSDPALGTDHFFNFNITPSYNLWETTVGSIDYNADTGAGFSVKKQRDSPTLRSKFYIFFGRYEVSLKVAPGTGIISSLMLLSDDLDEIDIEFKGANSTEITTNIFSKGDFDDHSYGKDHIMDIDGQADYHTYVVDWTKERLEWSVDGKVIRTLTYDEADGGAKYPQTPMRMNIGIWAGGDPTLPKGTIEWAGGETDYSKGPYTMFVKNTKIEDYTKNAKEYTYGDKTGSYQSIQVKEGNSTASKNIEKAESNGGADSPSGWSTLSSGAKIGIYAGAGSVGALALGFLIYYYLRQRRLGAAEAKAAEEKAEAERVELAQFRANGIDPDGFREHGQEYNEKGYDSSRPGTGNPFQHPDDSRPGSRHPQAPDAAMFAAGAGVAAAGAAASHVAPGTPTSPHGQYGNGHNSNSPPRGGPGGFDFGIPPSPSSSSFGPDAQRQVSRTHSDMMPPHHPQSPVGQMRSATADPYGGRFGSPGPQQGYGMNRMQSPMGQPGAGAYGNVRGSPGPMQSQQRTQSPGPGYSGGNQPAYRGQPGGGSGWN